LKYVVAQIDRKIAQYVDVGHSRDEAREVALNFFNSLMREQRACATLSGLERYLQKKMKEERQAQLTEEAHEREEAQQQQQT
jgi:hypothetical protein